ncbi:MAG: hypothetical protein NDF58_00790 [archaeon YNP-LCB-024-027]|jgi:hypothetical protein|nr:hypothetical protein [Candidatus Culexarchaeum yellowstonense]
MDDSISFTYLFWIVLGLFMIFEGFSSSDTITLTLGSALCFTTTMLIMSSTIAMDKPKLKTILNILSIIGSIIILMYGYIVTGSIFLEFLIMMAIAFSVILYMLRGKLMKYKH